MRTSIVAPLFLAALSTSALADVPARPKPSPTASLDVRSKAFGANQAIPAEYTCDGADTSPPLSWSKVPANTKSVAVFVDDPDAPKGTFTQWLVTGLPPTTTSLSAGAALPEGSFAARNDKGTTGYTGPCPPTGRHRYHFRVYALDINLAKPMTKADFMSEIAGHVLAQGELVGTYQKQGR